MSFRHVMIISLALMVSLPAWSANKSSHRKVQRGLASVSSSATSSSPSRLSEIYQTLMRDSQKKLTPVNGEQNFLFPVPLARSASRGPAAVFNPSAPAQHAAIPWASDTSSGGVLFSVK